MKKEEKTKGMKKEGKEEKGGSLIGLMNGWMYEWMSGCLDQG